MNTKEVKAELFKKFDAIFAELREEQEEAFAKELDEQVELVRIRILRRLERECRETLDQCALIEFQEVHERLEHRYGSTIIPRAQVHGNAAESGFIIQRK